MELMNPENRRMQIERKKKKKHIKDGAETTDEKRN